MVAVSETIAALAIRSLRSVTGPPLELDLDGEEKAKFPLYFYNKASKQQARSQWNRDFPDVMWLLQHA
jgi:hypothetical protein